MRKCKFCEYELLKGPVKVCKKCKSFYHFGCWYVLGRCLKEGCICSETYNLGEREQPAITSSRIEEVSEQIEVVERATYKTKIMDTKTKVASPLKKSGLKNLNWKRIAILSTIPVFLLFFILLLYFAIKFFNSNSVESIYGNGIKEMEQEKYEEAIKLFEKAFEKAPDFPDLKQKLIEAYRKHITSCKEHYKFNDALEALKRLSELTSEKEIKADLINFYILWGDYLLTNGNYQSAIEKFDKVLELDKTNEEGKQKRIHSLVSIIYDPEYELTEDLLKSLMENPDCKKRLEKDGIKLYSVQCQILKADINQDEYKDLIVAGEDMDSSSAGIDTYKIKAGKPELISSIDTSGYFLNKIDLIDLNYDKQLEIYSNWTEPGTTKRGFTVIVFGKDKLPDYRNSQQISDTPLTFEDINNDGKLEIIGKKLDESIIVGGEGLLIASIYQWQNYEFVDITFNYSEQYKKIYIDPVEKELENLSKIEDIIERAKNEDLLRKRIEKLYTVAGLEYDTKSGGKTPEETMELNFDYINKHEFYKAYMLRSNKRKTDGSFESFYYIWKNNISVKINELTLVEQGEDKAEVLVRFEATDQVKPGETKTSNYKGNYYLVKEGDLWYLDDSKVQ